MEFDRPDRVPRDVWVLPAARLRYGAALDRFLERWPTDFTQCVKGRPPARRAKGDPYAAGEAVDEWGCVFVNLVPGVHGEVKQPLVTDWADLDKVQPPLEYLDVDPGAVNAFCRQSDRFVFASGWARPFERLQFLRGTENLYVDFMEQSDEFLELFNRVCGFFRDQYERWAQTEVDALAMMDDWGSQRSLLIRPEQWRELFKPVYADYVRIAHDAGKKFFMHSDGYIFDIYEDLIEIGVDAINSQLFCMDIEEIGRRCAGRITFWGEIDRQRILPSGTLDDVRRAVRRVADNLSRPDGGVIAQFSFEGDTRIENADAAFDAWSRVLADT